MLRQSAPIDSSNARHQHASSAERASAKHRGTQAQQREIFSRKRSIFHFESPFQMSFSASAVASGILALVALSVLSYCVYAAAHSTAIEREFSRHPPQNFSKIDLPVKYLVGPEYLLPVHDQGHRGTCWAWSSIYILESQYRAQGIRQGFLKRNEFVPFSTEAFVTTMSALCQASPNKTCCRGSPRAKNESSGGWAEDLIDYTAFFPVFQRSILPESVCRYHNNETHQFHCPDLGSEIQRNPISYDIVSYAFRSGISNIKELLVSAERPLVFSLPMPYQRYWFYCDNPLVKDDESCRHKLFTCDGKSCNFHDYGVFKFSDTGLVHYPDGETVPGGGHAVALVGYNDEFVIRKAGDVLGLKKVKGGFILRNSWGPRGHSYQYLMEQISDDQEELLCPNEGDATRWSAVSSECITTTKNITQCNGDVLVCVNKTHCNVNHTYALIGDGNTSRAMVKHNELGTPIARVAEVTNGTVTIKDIDTVPFHFIFYAFQKVNRINNTDPRCGYLFLSYDTFEKLLAHAGRTASEITACDIELNFAPSSYHRSGFWRDYSHVKKSLRTFNTLDVQNPFEPVTIEPPEKFFERPPGI